jgi:hypothetical protein
MKKSTKIKSTLKTKNEILERKKFLDIYIEFNTWLSSLGFRQGHFWKESTTAMDCHYSHYEKYIDSLYSVEHYVHDGVKLSIRFLRDRYEHKFMFVGELGSYSETHTLEEMKEIILIECRTLKAYILEKYNALPNF